MPLPQVGDVLRLPSYAITVNRAKFGPDVVVTMRGPLSDGLVPCGSFINEPEDGQQPNVEYDTPQFGGVEDASAVWPIRALKNLKGPIELTVRRCRCRRRCCRP